MLKPLISRAATKGIKFLKRFQDGSNRSNNGQLFLLYEIDTFFNQTYDRGLQITQTPDTPNVYFSKRRIRFYNLIQFFQQTLDLPGSIIECGCWKGLSSYIMCQYLKRHHVKFQGENYFMIDSFEGLSQPQKEDLYTDPNNQQYFVQPKGHFQGELAEVKDNLKEFPAITYTKGWIPECLDTITDRQYKFVHLDLDLFEPISGSLKYFYPRLIKNGILIVDDYGSLDFPGARKAVDDFCTTNRIKLLTISSGQGIIFKS